MEGIEDILRDGLTATPKYIPVWYRYDEAGSIYNDKCLTDNQYYYFHRCEREIIIDNKADIISCVPAPYCIADLGSGNAEKTRILFDEILKGTSEVVYLPIDISEDFLRRTAMDLSKQYHGRLIPIPISGDYRKGITALRSFPDRKLILWFGSVQALPYREQIHLLKELADIMTDDDRLVITLDITQDSTTVENAYLDPTGVSAPLYLNALWRLNREMGADFDTNKFELKAKFTKSVSPNLPSHVDIFVTSKEDQTCHIPKLNLEMFLRKDEEIRLFEGEGTSCKYTLEQIHSLAKNSGMALCRYWTDKDKHAVLLCFKRQSYE